MSGGDDHTAPVPGTSDSDRLTGDLDAPGRSADPVDDRPGGERAAVEVDPWTTRCEVLALLASLVVAGTIAQNVFQGLHVAGTAEASGFSWSSFFASVSFTAMGPGSVLLLLVAALVLVVLSPGSSIGGLGSGVLQGVAVLGVLVATSALVGVVETLRIDGDQFDQPGFAVTGVAGLQKAAAIATFVPVGALAAGSALFAWRTLAEVAPTGR